jgi:hypothetical protein
LIFFYFEHYFPPLWMLKLPLWQAAF